MAEILYNKDLLAQPTISFQEVEIVRGETWRFGSGYQTLAANTNYATLNFTTPATGLTTYTFTNFAKSGQEVTLSLIEAGTYVSTGSSVLSGFNMNRNFSDTHPFGTVRFGLSTAGTTITGGTAFPETLIPGTAVGLTRPAGAANTGTVIYLKPATMYTFKALARGGSATFTFTLDLIYEDAD